MKLWVNPALKKWRQESQKLKASLGSRDFSNNSNNKKPKLNIEWSYDPAMPLLALYPKELKADNANK